MKIKMHYHIALLVGIGFTCLSHLDVNSQTRNSKSTKSSVHTVTSKSPSTVKPPSPKPESPVWYRGQILVPTREQNSGNNFTEMMGENNLEVLSVLTDKSNGREIREELPVIKTDAKKPAARIIHWDTEWRYKPAGNKDMGGLLALLRLKEAPSEKETMPYKILEWSKSQGAVTGFVFREQFNDSLENDSKCYFPLDYSVEAALGTIDFIAENSLQNDAVVRSYYRLLNCGFRIGLAVTDFPCKADSGNSSLTYVQVKDQPLTYDKWIEGIKKGRSVVSLNGHNEFLDIKANNSNGPGDEIKVKGQADVNVMVRWTATKEFKGRIELLCNGKVVATQSGTARPGASVILIATQKFIRSGWLSARRMDENGHITHTAPIYVIVNDQPIRASVGDAKYFISWIDHILDNTSTTTGGNKHPGFVGDSVKARYEKARDLYIKIQDETLDQLKKMGDGVLDNGSVVKTPVKKPVRHKSRYVRKK